MTTGAAATTEEDIREIATEEANAAVSPVTVNADDALLKANAALASAAAAVAQAQSAVSAANERVAKSGDVMTGNLRIRGSTLFLEQSSTLFTDVGSLASPAIQLGDSNTGFWLRSNNIMGVTAGGEDIITIDGLGSPFVKMTFGNSYVQFEEAGFGCNFKTVNDTGADWCNEQIGTLGSAYSFSRKALGTVAAQLPLLDGNKIGGHGYSAHHGVDDAVVIGAEIAAVAVGDQSDTNHGARYDFLVAEQDAGGQRVAMRLDHDGSLRLLEFGGAGDAPAVLDADGKFKRGSASPGGSVFGQHFQYAEGGDVITTATGVKAVEMASEALTAGTYRIAVFYKWAYDSTTGDFHSSLLIDGVKIGQSHQQEPKDSAGTGSTAYGGTNQRHPANYLVYQDFNDGDTPSIELWFNGTSGLRASTRDAVIEIWRVS